MSRVRKSLAGPEKLAVLKRRLVEKTPISDPCDQHGPQLSQINSGQAGRFEHGASIFERKPGRPSSVETAKDRAKGRSHFRTERGERQREKENRKL